MKPDQTSQPRIVARDLILKEMPVRQPNPACKTLYASNKGDFKEIEMRGISESM
jgi:hypothetical protein